MCTRFSVSANPRDAVAASTAEPAGAASMHDDEVRGDPDLSGNVQPPSAFRVEDTMPARVKASAIGYSSPWIPIETEMRCVAPSSSMSRKP